MKVITLEELSTFLSRIMYQDSRGDMAVEIHKIANETGVAINENYGIQFDDEEFYDGMAYAEDRWLGE